MQLQVPRHRIGSAVTALLLLLALPAGGALAEEGGGRGPDDLARLRDLVAQPAAVGGAATPWGYADAQCVSDPPGGTFRVTDDGAEVPTDFPRADIRAHCADHEPTELALRLRTAAPTDPRSDPSWRSAATRAMWFLDAGGGFAFVVVLRHDGTRLLVELLEVGEDGAPDRLRCLGRAEHEEGWLVAAGLDPGPCLDGPRRIAVAPVMAYDEDPQDPLVPVHLDAAAHVNAVGRSDAPTLRRTDRLAGADRMATAAAIAEREFPAGAPAAYLARADDFPDALAAGSLARGAATRGPIFLVPTCGALPEPVTTALARLDPERITALGGRAAVCDEVLAQAATAGRTGAPRDVARLALSGTGANRFGTAVAIARRAWPTGAAEVHLATGERFPDALAAAALTEGPVLLVPTCGPLPEVVTSEIARLDPQRVVALGGTAAVCEPTLAAAAAAGVDAARPTLRLAGASRFATAAEIARSGFPDGTEQVLLARADDFPDALAAASVDGSPVLLVPRCGDLPPEVARAIRQLAPTRVVALGGVGAVCPATLRAAANA